WSALLARQERALGTAHVATRRTRTQLAICAYLSGDLAAAEARLTSILENDRDALGPESGGILLDRASLSLVRLRLGAVVPETERWRDIAVEVAALLGDRHTQTLSSRHNLAVAEFELGRPEAALELARQVLAARLAAPGVDPWATQRIRRDLGTFTHRG